MPRFSRFRRFRFQIEGMQVSTGNEDKAFFVPFAAVMGVLVAIAVVSLIIAKVVVAMTTPSDAGNVRVALVDQRTAPLGVVNTSAEAAKQMAQQMAKSKKSGGASGKPMSGKEVYTNVCSACHGSGVMGAPKFGNTDSWTPHAKKGLTTLYDHALHGFKAMPAKGGHPDLTEKDVENGVQYMLKNSGVFDIAKQNAK